MSTVRQALSVGLVLGAAWGLLEAGWLVLRPWFALSARLGRPAPLEWVQTAQVLALGALHDALLLAAVLLLVLPVLALLRRPRDEAAGRRRAVRVGLGFVVFLNLYWHTKSWWEFTDGLPFHHPARLAVAAGFLGLAALVAWALARPGWITAPGRGATRAVVALLVLAGGWGLWHENRVRSYAGVPAPEGAPNVLFVVVDALRADRLGAYGHEREPSVSPRVDQLAREGVLFERAWAQAPFTWTSFGSFLTGKYPRQHGLIKMSPDLSLDPRSNRTVAAALQDAGYATGAFMTGTLSNSTGLLHGFDTYFETIVGHEPVHRASKWSVVRSRMLLFVFWNKLRQALDPELLNTEAKRWIRDHAHRPFFAFVHYYSTHTPFDPPGRHKRVYLDDAASPYDHWYQSYAVMVQRSQREGACWACGAPTWTCEHFDPERDVPAIDALYDAGVRYADEMTGELLDLLEELGVADDTLVVFTSDHGEELYDHAVFEHDWMFETNLHVPLVLRLPGKRHAGTRVGWPVELIDLPPTILDVAGVGSLERPASAGGAPAAPPSPGAVRDTRYHLATPGRSLLPDAAGVDPGAAEKVIFAENVRYIALSDGTHKLVASRFAGPRRFERRDGARFFDHAEDPRELAPLWPDQPGFAEASAELRAYFERYDAAMPRANLGRKVTDNAQAVETLRALAELGYAGQVDATLEAALEGDERAVSEVLGETSLLGSNEMFEEELYAWPHDWPPARQDDE